MSLRGFNNPNDVLTVMDVLKALIAVDLSTGQPNTRIGEIQAATGNDLIYIQDYYGMLRGPKPAVHIEAGPQRYFLDAQSGREGQMLIKIKYCDSWDAQPDTISNIKRNNMIDLMRIHGNIENNDTLEFHNANHAMSIPEMTLGGYEGAIDNTTIPGASFVCHDLNIVINALPYGV